VTEPEPDVRREAARARPLDRVLGAIPIALVVLWLGLVELLETTWKTSPSIFSDEVEWTQLSRGIAETGRAAARGEPAPFKSLYSFVLAPAWWIQDTAQAYDVAKYLTMTAMVLTAVPAYLLARRLVRKPAALAVAAATISIPSMVYGLYLIPEGVAYPWATLCALLITGALAARTRWWIGAAVVASALAPLVRGQLAIVPAAFACAALGLWATGPRGRAARRSWSPGDYAGAVLLAIGAFLVFNRWLLHGNEPWALTSEFYRGWIWQHVHWSLGALTIGVGVLPLLGTVCVLFRRPGEEQSPWERAFVAVLVSYVFWFALYTGVKAAYLQTKFATLVTERNLFYVAPLMFLATAVVVERRRVRAAPLAAATAIAVALVATTPLQLGYPYFEAFGFSILTWANRAPLYFSEHTLHRSLYVVVGIAAALLFAVRELRLPRQAAVAGVTLLASCVIAWNVGGEISAARAAGDSSDVYLAGFPLKPPNAVDRAVGDGSVTYLGQQLQARVEGVDLLEFWNRSIKHVWSLDGSAPGPGPTLSPDLATRGGRLSPAPGTSYLLADSGVDPVGTPIGTVQTLRLYHLAGPIRLRSWVTNVGGDGWMVADAAYNRFVTPGRRAGLAVVDLDRTPFCPDASRHAPIGRITVAVGTLVINDNHQPVMGTVRQRRSIALPNCADRRVELPVGPPPWRVEVHIDGTFVPAEWTESSDQRTLGARVGFDYAAR
jgi:hypothetical protein